MWPCKSADRPLCPSRGSISPIQTCRVRGGVQHQTRNVLLLDSKRGRPTPNAARCFEIRRECKAHRWKAPTRQGPLRVPWAHLADGRDLDAARCCSYKTCQVSTACESDSNSDLEMSLCALQHRLRAITVYFPRQSTPRLGDTTSQRRRRVDDVQPHPERLCWCLTAEQDLRR